MESKYSKAQRIAAWVCIVVIGLMYLSTLVFALLKFAWAKSLLRVSLGCTLVLPLMAWAYIWMIGKLTHKATIADLNIGGQPTNHDGIVVNTVENEPSHIGNAAENEPSHTGNAAENENPDKE